MMKPFTYCQLHPKGCVSAVKIVGGGGGGAKVEVQGAWVFQVGWWRQKWDSAEGGGTLLLPLPPPDPMS